MEVSDEQLMLDYAGGDAAAFEVLYRKHRGGLFRYVVRSVREQRLAEELFQEVWLKVIEARARYAPQAKFTTWLYAIAHNRLIDHFRASGLRSVEMMMDELPDPPARAGEQPEQKAEVREQGARLIAALEAMPIVQREAFLLHEEAGLSVPEIAEVTGTEVEATKSRLRYAVAKLREALKD
ncbi:MAG: RNA polymerase sigma factor [Betaproteobacteria bacterium]|nr:RNA polymerase sigma factor [Betaproteobacteria bacterium]